MTPNFRSSLIVSATAFAAIFSGCGPADPNGFTVVDALGGYNVTLDQNIVLSSTYHSSPAVSATVTFAELGQSNTTVSGAGVVYNAATNLFTVTLTQTAPSVSTTTVLIDGTAVKAIDNNGAVVAFTPTATNLTSVTLNVPIAGANTITTQATGCEQSLTESLILVLTVDGMDGTIVATESYTTVGYQGASPYVSCADWLGGIETVLRGGGTDTTTSGLTTYVVNGGISINTMSDLSTFTEKLHFSGKKAVAPSKPIIIQSGPIADIKILR